MMQTMRFSPRGTLVWQLILIACLASACARRDRPNLLLITIDTLRADHLGCYGFGLAKTPVMDRLAEQGVRFADAISAAPITLPSHATIMTGLFPPAHGVRDNGAYALGGDSVTLAERLKSDGYATHAIVSAIVLNRRYELTQGFDQYDDDLWSEDDPKMFMIRDRPAARTAERAVRWLGEWNRTSSKTPFFMWVHFFDPHQPYDPPQKFRVVSPSLYDGEIAASDEGVGAVIDELSRIGVLERTLVVLVADHGESLGEHAEKTHALFVYDATVRVPMILRYPKALPAGRVYDGPVRTVDIVPTVLGLVGLRGGSETQGVDLTPFVRNGDTAPTLPQYSESLLSEVGFGMSPLYALRRGGFKYIRAPKPELYDLRADPHELKNLYSVERDTALSLDHDLQSVVDDSSQRATKPVASPMDRETEETLRSLGYLASPSERSSMAGMDPKDGLPLYNKLEDARHAAQGKNWESAERLLREILEEIPRHVAARSILGMVLFRQGRLADARQEYTRALADDPGQWRLYLMLGSIAMSEGALDQAEGEFRKAIASSPGAVEALANLGFLESLRGNEADAREWYAKAIAVDPHFPRIYRLLGDLSYERGDHAGALVQYRLAIGITPTDFRALIQAGNCARRTGDAAEARSYYEKAARLRPDSWIPAYNLACLAAVTGDRGAAITQLETAVRQGLHDRATLDADHDLDSIRNSPEFARIAGATAPAPTSSPR